MQPKDGSLENMPPKHRSVLHMSPKQNRSLRPSLTQREGSEGDTGIGHRLGVFCGPTVRSDTAALLALRAPFSSTGLLVLDSKVAAVVGVWCIVTTKENRKAVVGCEHFIEEEELACSSFKLLGVLGKRRGMQSSHSQ